MASTSGKFKLEKIFINCRKSCYQLERIKKFFICGIQATTMGENVQNSESTIFDGDMSKEMSEYTKSNILSQVVQSMLAQGNQNSSSVLSLLS